jgi:hypothetical protein
VVRPQGGAYGAQGKPYPRSGEVNFINGYPGVIALFLRFLDATGAMVNGPREASPRVTTQ